MKSQSRNSTALKALLLAVVGANFLANLRFNATNVSHLSLTDEAVTAVKQGEIAGGVDVNLTQSPPQSSKFGEETRAAAPPAQRAPAPRAAAPTQAPGARPAVPEAGRTGGGGRPAAPAADRQKPEETRGFQDRSALDVRVPGAPQTQRLGTEAGREGLSVCGMNFDLRFEVTRVGNAVETTVEARRANTPDDSRPVTSIPSRVGDARGESRQAVDFRHALRADIASRLRSITPACNDDSSDADTRADRIANCEINQAGQALNARGQFDCALNRLSQLGRGQRRGMNAERVFAQAEDLTAKLMDGLQALASNNCEIDQDRSLCSLGAINRENSPYVQRIVSALRLLKTRMGSLGREERSRGLDRQMDQLIAKVRQVIPNARGEILAERAQREADRAKDDARDLRDQIREVNRELQANGCRGQRGGICGDLMAEYDDLRQERADLFDRTHAASDYDKLQSLASRMDPREARRLLTETRRDYMRSLADIRNIDPLDRGWNSAMDDAMGRIARSAGLNGSDLAGIPGFGGANGGLNNGQYATVIDPRTGQPMAVRVNAGVNGIPGAGYGAGIPGVNGLPNYNGVNLNAGMPQGGYAQVIGGNGAVGIGNGGYNPAMNQFGNSPAMGAPGFGGSPVITPGQSGYAAAIPTNRTASPGVQIPMTAPNFGSNGPGYSAAPPLAVNNLNGAPANGFGRSAVVPGMNATFTTTGGPAALVPGRTRLN